MQFQPDARSAFDALLYPPKSDSSIQYLQAQFQQLSPMLNDLQVEFYRQAQQQFETSNSEAAREYARQVAAQSFAHGHVQTEHITPLCYIDDFQNATTTMQRWMMANPETRRWRNEQRCDGWSSTYVDHEPERMGMAHFDYRRVVSDVLLEEPGGGYVVTHISECIPDHERELSLREQRDVIAAWHCLDTLMARLCEDPTDPAGSLL
jgi:hypothetical protein